MIEPDREGRIRALTSEAASEIDLLDRLTVSARKALTFGRGFGVAPRRWLAAIGAGVGCATLVLVTMPVSTALIIAPLAGVVGGSLGALLVPRDVEAQREAELRDLQDRIAWAKRNSEDEILIALRQRYAVLVTADAPELSRILGASSIKLLAAPVDSGSTSLPGKTQLSAAGNDS